MYLDSEVDISRAHLERVLASLEEPVLILGGWAVYLQVVDGFRETTGRDYLGSRDIDLGFSMVDEDLKRAPIGHAITCLEEVLGFQPLSFRFMREFDNETGEPFEPEVSKRMPIHRIFQMYVDLMVDRVPDGFKDAFGFIPPDEPLLTQVFDDPDSRWSTSAFGKVVWMPSPPVLLRMKARSFTNRTRDHKRIKDLADITALLLFSDVDGMELDQEDREAFFSSLQADEVEQAASALGIGSDVVETALDVIRSL